MKKTLFMQTTGVSANKTVMEIQALLADYGATAILTEYQNGEVVEISFKYVTDGVEHPYRLPSKWEEVKTLLLKNHYNWKFKKDINEISKRVAWRQTFRWVEAQFAYVQTNQVKFEQAFLSYMQDQNGQTLFEKLEETKFKLLEHRETPP